jgi:opacity protein-like surface antigen
MLKIWLLSLTAGLSSFALCFSASAGTTLELLGGPSFFVKDTVSLVFTKVKNGIPLTWNTGLKLTPDAGYAVGAIVSYQFENGLALGLEGTFRRADLDVNGAATAVVPLPVPTTVTVPIHRRATEKAFALLIDISYERPVAGPLSVYVEQGNGAAWNSSLHFAWQVGAGFNIALTQRVALSIGYRHFDGGTVEVRRGRKAKLVSNDMKVGLKVKL